MWVEFTEVFTWKPQPNVMVDFAPGVTNVTTRCGQAAIAAGRAKRAKAPARPAPAPEADGDGGS